MNEAIFHTEAEREQFESWATHLAGELAAAIPGEDEEVGADAYACARLREYRSRLPPASKAGDALCRGLGDPNERLRVALLHADLHPEICHPSPHRSDGLCDDGLPPWIPAASHRS